MKPLRVAYFGSPEISRMVLEDLTHNPLVRIVAVYTQPDKRVGRKQILTPCPVKRFAQDQGIPVTHKLDVQILRSCDLAIVYAYGHIIPADILAHPANGFWNIHPSLLPAYRGPAPIAYPLLYADTITGCTIIQMDELMDHGAILVQEQYAIPPEATRDSLEQALTRLGSSLLVSCIEALCKRGGGAIVAHPQTHAKATYTKKLTKEDGYIPFRALKQAIIGEGSITDFTGSPIQKLVPPPTTPPHTVTEIIIRLWKALYGWPGIWTTVMVDSTEKRLKILELDPTSVNSLRITMVQLEGKKPVDWPTFARAYQDTMG